MSTFKAEPVEAPPAQPEGLVVNFGLKEKRALVDQKSKFMIEEIKSEQLEKLKA